jgi:hypothetical protein
VPKKFYRTLWTFSVPDHMFINLSGKWHGYATPEDRNDERLKSSPKHGSWSSNWLNVKKKRSVLRMCDRSPTGYAVFRRYKRTRGQWQMVQWEYSAPWVNVSEPHPASLWCKRETEPLTPRERMKRRK